LLDAINKAGRIMRQIDARWPGNFVPSKSWSVGRTDGQFTWPKNALSREVALALYQSTWFDAPRFLHQNHRHCS
jgi:hypothetical protein